MQQQLIEHIQDFGIAREDLFHPKDLTELRNIPRVCRCLMSLRTLVGYRKKKQLFSKVCMIMLQLGTNYCY